MPVKTGLAIAVAAAVLYFEVRPSPAQVTTTQATASGPAAKVTSRRERMARLVAETAAINAERTAKQVLARKGQAEETAAR